MARIIEFKTKELIACDKFIADAQALPIFGAAGGLDFEKVSWNVGGLIKKLSENTRQTTIAFKAPDSPPGKKALAMPAPLGDAVKAAVAQKLWATRGCPKSVGGYDKLAKCGQCLYSVMKEDNLGGDITRLTGDHLTRAIPLKQSRTLQDHVGYGLQTLARIWAEAGIAPDLEGWEYTADRSARRSRLHPQHARDNLTDDEIYAIARTFHAATTEYEQVITSVLALLCCAPSRHGELVILPERVEVLERPGEDCVPHDVAFHEDTRFRFGLRWWPGKGAAPMIKFVPAEMVPVAKEALRRIRKHTQPARELARWMEDNPDKMPLPPDLAHVRISGEIGWLELSKLLGRDPGQDTKWTKNFKRLRLGIYDFASVEDWWRENRPPGWPLLSEHSGVRYSDALLLLHPNQLSEAWFTDTTRIVMLNENDIFYALTSSHGRPTIFERLDVRLPDGSYPNITTHQIRHYLNTIAQRANVPQAHIAYWSGRKNVMQNRDYDHTDILDVVDQIKKQGKYSDLIHSVPMIVDENDGPDLVLLEASIRTTVHSTPFGFCVSNLTHDPCSRAMACVGCTRLVCIVGNMDQGKNVAAHVVRSRKTVDNLRAMEAKGRRVNPRMKAATEAQLAHAEALLEVLMDPANEGAVIRNADVPDLVEFNHGNRAFAARQKRDVENLTGAEQGAAL